MEEMWITFLFLLCSTFISYFKKLKWEIDMNVICCIILHSLFDDLGLDMLDYRFFHCFLSFFAVHCMVISIGLGCCCYIHNIIVCYGLVSYCDTFWVSKVLLSQAQLLCRVKYVILYLILTDLSSISKYMFITWSIEIKNHAIQIKYPYKYWYLVFKKI